jgi:ATP-dependent Zn protease
MRYRTIFLFFFFITVISSSTHALDWAYSFVVWDGKVYRVTDEKVVDSLIGKRIGSVKRKANDMTGNYYGDASNTYPKGTNYYEIIGESSDKVLALELDYNLWVKAVYIHEAPFHWMNVFSKIFPIIILIAIFIVVRTRIKKAKTN